MHVIAIMLIIACSSVKDGWNLLALGWFMSLTTRNLSCPVRHSHSEYPRQGSCGSHRCHRHYPVPPEQHISWRSRRPTTGCWRWMQDVVRQLVGWDGRGTCNESQGVEPREDAWRKVPCDLDASPCLGHAIVCSACAVPIPHDCSGSA